MMEEITYCCKTLYREMDNWRRDWIYYKEKLPEIDVPIEITGGIDRCCGFAISTFGEWTGYNFYTNDSRLGCYNDIDFDIRYWRYPKFKFKNYKKRKSCWCKFLEKNKNKKSWNILEIKSLQK